MKFQAIRNNDSILSRKPADHGKRLTDGDGLYLKLHWLDVQNTEAGKVVKVPRHSWRFDYSKPGERNDKGVKVRSTLVFGTFPELSIAAARQKAADARALVAQGIDPAGKRAAPAAAPDAANDDEQPKEGDRSSTPATPGTFRHAALAYMERCRVGGMWGTSYQGSFEREMNLRVFPAIGEMRLADIDVDHLTDMIDPMVLARRVDTAKRSLTMAARVFGFARAKKLCKRNPAREYLDDIGVEGIQAGKRNQPALHDEASVSALALDIDAYGGDMARRCLQLCLLLWQRPGTIRTMEWCEVDLDAGMWVIPAMRMKLRQQAKISGQPHYVPLSRQAVAILREQRRVVPVGTKHVFPHTLTQGKPMDHATMNDALQRMGYKDRQTPHGFRATGRSLCAEKLGYKADILEAHLAHRPPKDQMGATYMRSTFVEERKELVQRWADYVDTLRAGVLKKAA